jgi:urease accessory protein
MPVPITGIPMITEQALLRLSTWLSPAFPVGAYTYSHGLEYAVETSLVADRESLVGWIEAIVSDGTGRIDASLFVAAWRALADDDRPALHSIVERGVAMRATAEMALEAEAQGTAFLATVRATWPHPRLVAWVGELGEAEMKPSYPIAVAVVAAIAEIPLRPVLCVFLQAFAANLVSAGLRLIPLGQTDGQHVIEALHPKVIAAADAALNRSIDDWGAATAMVDWTSMKHETQYTRLFRS